MLADTAQLDRWQQMLDVPIDEQTWLHALDNASTGRRTLIKAVAGALEDRSAQPPTVDVPGEVHPPPSRLPAVEGLNVARTVWITYLQWRDGRPSADPWLRAMIDLLAPTALVFTADDNPEPWWQAEMIILHALHSFALRSRDRGLLDKTLACADFHLREIQPDHATNEPWSVHAYASHHDGNVTAETLWHAAYIQHGGAPGPVARLLAREASASLAIWLGR